MISKLSIINRVKYSKFLYAIYYYLGSFGINILKFFLKTDDKLIVFNSYGGRKYDDSPKAIYEKMIIEPRFMDYKFVWSFLNPDEYIVPRATKIKVDTFTYYITLIKARVWVTNSSMTRGLDFQGKHTFVLNTWHSTTVKKIGNDVNKSGQMFLAKSKKGIPNIMLAQGTYDVNMLSRVFNLPKEIFRITGFPRNDRLACATEEDKNKMRAKLGIPNSKKVLLYAPTFREYEKDKWGNCVLSMPVDFNKWKEKLGNEYVMLLRAHYEVVKILEIKEDGFVRNVSNYPELNDLMIASDVLVSDYSSIFVDFAILGRPMFCFAYDYDEYGEKRGLCFDIRKELSSYNFDEDTLINNILSMDVEEKCSISRKFCSKFIEKCGNAAQLSVNFIYDAIAEKK